MFTDPKTEAAESGGGLRITGDKASMEALVRVMQCAESEGDQDLADWADDSIRALRAGAAGGNVTLPAFRATPSLDSFDDDQGPGPEGEEY